MKANSILWIRITDDYITIGVFIITNLYILIYYINTAAVYSVTGIRFMYIE